MAAGDVLEGENDENEGGYFQHPKGQHRQGVRNKKLQQRRQYRRKRKAREGGPIGREHKISAQAKDKQRQRDAGNGQVSYPSREKQTEAVSQVVDRLEKKLTDVAVFDVPRDLPIVLVYRGQRIDDSHQQI